MKTLHSWNDLKPFGINILTGEACSYSMRLLCDLNEDGVEIFEHFLSVRREGFADNWNTYVGEKAAIASIMIPYTIFRDLTTFILLYKGHDYVMSTETTVIGMTTEEYKKHSDDLKDSFLSETGQVQTSINPATFSKAPNVGGRNVHSFTGRIE